MTREDLTNLADTVMVMPNALILYVCSAATIILLLLLGRHNRKIGWRRNRNNTEWLVTRELYADYAAALLSPGAASLSPPPIEPERLRAQLLALSAALTADERSTPIGAPDMAVMGPDGSA